MLCRLMHAFIFSISVSALAWMQGAYALPAINLSEVPTTITPADAEASESQSSLDSEALPDSEEALPDSEALQNTPAGALRHQPPMSTLTGPRSLTGSR